jgi:CheY-like chemotaxis protein
MAHILLVEDDADVVTFARGLLESHGLTVDVANDGEAAMVAYMTRKPDVILLDVFVPRIDGLRFARQVQTNFPLDRTPIVVWTGAYEPESIGDLLDTPHVLHKPVAGEELLEVVRRALGDETKSRALRVLVVSQSNASLRGLVGELRAEFDVHTASRWEEVLALLEVRPYEAVIVDVAGEAREGAAVLRHIAATHRQIGRVALIAPAQAALGRELESLGAAEAVLPLEHSAGALADRLHAILG